MFDGCGCFIAQYEIYCNYNSQQCTYQVFSNIELFYFFQYIVCDQFTRFPAATITILSSDLRSIYFPS